ncbi:hypothetical protein PFISCL1PPCAC_17164, partial [Pristionchus fissidentatus]
DEFSFLLDSDQLYKEFKKYEAPEDLKGDSSEGVRVRDAQTEQDTSEKECFNRFVKFLTDKITEKVSAMSLKNSDNDDERGVSEEQRNLSEFQTAAPIAPIAEEDRSMESVDPSDDNPSLEVKSEKEIEVEAAPKTDDPEDRCVEPKVQSHAERLGPDYETLYCWNMDGKTKKQQGVLAKILVEQKPMIFYLNEIWAESVGQFKKDMFDKGYTVIAIAPSYKLTTKIGRGSAILVNNNYLLDDKGEERFKEERSVHGTVEKGFEIAAMVDKKHDIHHLCVYVTGSNSPYTHLSKALKYIYDNYKDKKYIACGDFNYRLYQIKELNWRYGWNFIDRLRPGDSTHFGSRADYASKIDYVFSSDQILLIAHKPDDRGLRLKGDHYVLKVDYSPNNRNDGLSRNVCDEDGCRFECTTRTLYPKTPKDAEKKKTSTLAFFRERPTKELRMVMKGLLQETISFASVSLPVNNTH